MTLRAFSYGGGVQSTAALVLAAEGRIDFPVFLFANVGDDSEHPKTLEFVDKWAKPYARAHDIELHELERHRRDGSVETLWGRMHNGSLSQALPIPVRMDSGAPGQRSCTRDFKVLVLGKWLKAHGASKDDPATVGIGISVDEIERAGRKHGNAWETITYPLLDLGLTRNDCTNIIRDAGLPIPHKSSCFFCPFHRPLTWREMARDEPELFEKAVLLERKLNATRAARGKDQVWLTRFGRPLDEAVHAAQDTLFADEGPESCDSGHCWT